MKRSFRPTSPEPLPSLRRTSERDTISLLGRGRRQTEVQVSPQRKTRIVTQRYTRNVKSKSSKLSGRTTVKDREISGNTEIFLNPTLKDIPGSMQATENKSHDTLNSLDSAQTFGEDFELPALSMQNQEDNSVNEELSLYVDAVQSECVGFIKLYDNLFAVEGWTKTTGMGTNKWSHFEVTTDLSGERRLLCSCRLGALDCFHKRYFNLHGQDDFKNTESHANKGTCPHIILFTKERMDYDGERAMYRFSVARTKGSLALLNRVFVTHEGSDKGGGSWKCSRDGLDCIHIDSVKKCMGYEKDKQESTEDAVDITMHQQQARPHSERAISHLPIPPPEWAILESDNIQQHLPVFRVCPEVIELGPRASCACRDGGRAFLNPELPFVVRQCTVYTLTQAFKVDIQLQPCPRCPRESRRYIGPEPQDVGLFNYNNFVLFSHEVMNEYVSAFSGSVTPFEAWVEHMNRRYLATKPYSPFARSTLFRSAWFAYARLLMLEGDKTCPRCGNYPETVIWDGVSIAFARKHINDGLQPPTETSEDSQIRGSKPFPRQEWLIDGSWRKRLREWLGAGGLGVEGDKGQKEDEKGILAAIERTKSFSVIADWLRQVNAHLGELFNKHLGFEATRGAGKWRPRTEFRSLFELISADESTMQTLNRTGLRALHAFLQQPAKQNSRELLCVPVVYRVLDSEIRLHGRISDEVVEVCRWMYRRGEEVMSALLQTEQIPLVETLPRGDHVFEWRDWEKTGCCYEMPQIRKRPKYPKIPKDGNADVNKERNGTCRKYYEQYSQKRLTGGIMAAWCTHSVCFGFHCIPSGEGRNDVFSAIVTRWPRAPKRIIYDFACALGPYCWTREPEFFAETLFLIDDFHASGHSKCSTSSFLKTHADVDSRMAPINSSAAECGNSGLARIRKSVSYMTQPRAILYVWTFISIWNRLRIRKLNEQAASLD